MYTCCSQSPVACSLVDRWIWKYTKTLVWLNLLSLGTKDLSAPTIGIQSATNHYNFHKKHSPTTNTLLHHRSSHTAHTQRKPVQLSSVYLQPFCRHTLLSLPYRPGRTVRSATAIPYRHAIRVAIWPWLWPNDSKPAFFYGQNQTGVDYKASVFPLGPHYVLCHTHTQHVFLYVDDCVETYSCDCLQSAD